MSSETFESAESLAVAPQTDAATLARNNLVIYTLLASTFVVMLNEMATTVAIPKLMIALNVNASAAQWLTTAFLLTMAVVIPVTGFLMQRLNTRPVFLLAMSLFSVGTLLAAVAQGLPFLILGRIVQASGTAIMMPLMMTTMMTLVPPDQRGKMMGNVSVVMSVAPALGPVLAGFILEYFEWRWLFIVMLPIALVALGVGYRLIVNVSETRYAPLDVLSVVLAAVAFGGVVYGLSNFVEPDAPIPGGWALAVGAMVMVVFVLRQLKLQGKDAALLDLRTLKVLNFTISMSMIAILMLAMFGVMVLLPMYLQQVLGFSVAQTGLLMMPGSLLMGLLGPFVGRLFDKHGPAPLIIPAMTIICAVLWAMTLLGPDTWWVNIFIGHLIISVGFGFLFGPLFTTSLGSVPMQFYGHGSALLGSIQQVAGAAGVALFVAIMSAQSASQSLTGVGDIAALAHGIRIAFIFGAVVALFAFAASFFVKRPPQQDWGH